MKKMLLFATALIALLPVACSHSEKSCSGSDCSKDAVYTGVLPAADADGVRYTLTLDYDDDHNYTTGDYDLVEVYLQGDTTSATGYHDAASYRSEGDFSVITGQGADSSKKYIKLVKDARDSSTGSVDGPLYFMITSDNTLEMVNDQLQPSETPGMNYTLTKVQ